MSDTELAAKLAEVLGDGAYDDHCRNGIHNPRPLPDLMDLARKRLADIDNRDMDIARVVFGTAIQQMAEAGSRKISMNEARRWAVAALISDGQWVAAAVEALGEKP